MKKIIALIAFLLVCAAAAPAHAVNPYAWKGTTSTTTRKATETMSGDIKVFDNIDRATTSFEVNGGTLTIKNQAGIGKLLTSNATGIAAWTQMTYNAPPSELAITTGSASTLVLTANSIGIQEYVAVAVSTTVDITKAGAGGLDTGAEAASTWYYGYLIFDSSGTNGVGFMLSVSSFNPTMPSGFNKKVRVTAVYNNASSNFNHFYQLNDRVILAFGTIPTGGMTGAPTTAAWTVVTLSTVTSPPIAMDVILGAEVANGAGGGTRFLIGPVGVNSVAGTEFGMVCIELAVNGGCGSTVQVRQNASRQVAYYVDTNASGFSGAVTGFIFPFR